MTHFTTSINVGDPIAGREHDALTKLAPLDLIDHIESGHHRYLWHELPRLCDVIDMLVSAHGERHPQLIDLQHLYAQLQADFELHLIKEEQALFPLIRELGALESSREFTGGSLKTPISLMIAEHDHLLELLARIRIVSDDFVVPTDASAAYKHCLRSLENLEIDSHLHVHEEDQALFPAAIALEARMRDAG
jgi:regulator of cell morphogenesis and NO signaling